MSRPVPSWNRARMQRKSVEEGRQIASQRMLRIENLQSRKMLAGDIGHELEASAIPAEVALPGDVNGDGLMQPVDVLGIANALESSAGLESNPALDANIDGQLTNADVNAALASVMSEIPMQEFSIPYPFEDDYSEQLGFGATAC